MNFRAFIQKRKVALLIGGGFGVVVVGVVGMEVTMSPGFCGSCHIMKPYHAEWKTSAHKDVACVKCHIEPGLANLAKRKMAAAYELVSVVTDKMPSRPHSDVRDIVCLQGGCHSVDSLAKRGAITFGHSVRFDHGNHLGEASALGPLRCVSCHSQTGSSDQHAHVGLNTEVCILCHARMADAATRSENDFCLTCHSVPEEEIKVTGTDLTYSHADHSGEGVRCADCHHELTTGSGNVARRSCTVCHKNEALVARISETEEMHKIHVHQYKVECQSCHEMFTHESSRSAHGPQSEDCAQCHSARHVQSALLYRGEGGRGVESMPGTKFRLGIDCGACHREREALVSGSKRSPADACVACHDADAASYLNEWKKEIAASTAQVSRQLARAAAAGKESPASSDARHNLELVEQGGGAHNPEYALKLLEYSKQALEQTMAPAPVIGKTE